jgi:calcium/proton exchanger cax
MSVTLLFLYVMFLCFQLGSHSQGYDEAKQFNADEEAHYRTRQPNPNNSTQEGNGNAIPMQSIGLPIGSKKDSLDNLASESDDGSSDEPELGITAAIILLVLSASLASICAEFLVGSIELVIEHAPITETFLGLIILPLLGNAAELSTAVTVAIKNKMDLAINVTIGSGIQISLFMAPTIVILGWMIGRDVSLYFDVFQTVALLITVVMVNLLLLSGRSNYLLGALLLACYVIIGLENLSSSLGTSS